MPLFSMIKRRQVGNGPCFLWVFLLLSFCCRRLLCLFVVSGSVCRRGLKQWANKKELKIVQSKRYWKWAYSRWAWNTFFVFWIFLCRLMPIILESGESSMPFDEWQNVIIVIFVVVSKGNGGRWGTGFVQDWFRVLALYDSLQKKEVVFLSLYRGQEGCCPSFLG